PSPPAAWRQAVLIEERELPRPAGGPISVRDELAVSEGSAAPRRGPLGVLEPPEAGVGARDAADAAYVGLRSRRFKYVEYTSGERELYDLRRDPDELENLWKRADPALLARLSAILTALRTCAGASCRAADSVAVPDPAGP
ncbi:MAG TPA: hypothetical protein VIH93_11120, partial [Thermoanaerobaculia bacterium]